MANNTINTRIKLKYDTLANWTSKDPVLLKGELAIVAIPTDATAMQIEGTTPPQILFKVGDGTSKFSQLQYASSKAADVYAWAKAASKPTYNANEIKVPDGMLKDASVGNVLNSHIGATNPHSVTAAQVGAYTKAEVDNKLDALVDNDTTYTFTQTDKGFTITPKGGTAQPISFDYLTQAEVEALTVAKAKGISTVIAAGGGSSGATTFRMPFINTDGNFVEGVSQYGILGKGVVVEVGNTQPIIKADISGNAATATKATQDGSGNNIVNTYATKEELEEAISEIDYPVDSVNGKKGTVVLTAGDVNAYTKTEVNSAISEASQNLQGQIDDLDSDLSQRIANVETVVNGTDADTMDSVAELIDYVKEHGTEVTQMQADIKANADAIDVIEAKPAMGITSTQITNWGTAYTNSHTHTNKTVLDGITSAKVTNWDSASTNSHTHSNKTVLDGITSTKVTNWDEISTVKGYFTNGKANTAAAADTAKAVDAGGQYISQQGTAYLPAIDTNGNFVTGVSGGASLGKGITVAVGSSGLPSLSANISGNAATATKATQDGSGNNIVNTYATKAEAVLHSNARADYYIIDCGDASN